MQTSQEYVLFATKELNKPTVKVSLEEKKYLLYSKYNPTRDSKAFANESYDEGIEDYLIYGLGLGYHIKELENLIKIRGKKYHIYVIECNEEILKPAIDNINLSSILNNENITFIMMKNDQKFYNKLKKILSIDNIKIAIHIPSLNIIPDDFIDLKYLLEEFIVKQNSIETYSRELNYNYKNNIKNFDDNVDSLFNKYQNRPLYLVAAGPSLDKNVMLNYKGKK